jgi:CRISPR-associated protein Csb2
MIGVSLRFPAGRYHATPWGRHVNEGIPEWPPSPWRFLRAIIATWKRTLPDVEEERIRAILSELREAPEYRLPPATVGHTRHFMPWDKQWVKKRDASRTMVFDTFVAVSKDEPVFVFWKDARLSDDQQVLLEKLLSNIPFLGRAESWCIASLADAQEADEFSVNVRPLGEDSIPGEDEEITMVLVPDGDLDMDNPLDEDHPLLVRTTVLREEEKRIDPPGSRWVKYLRPRDCFEPEYQIDSPGFEESSVKIVRYLLDASPLPPITEALPIADLTRVAAMSVYGGPGKRRSAVLSGRDKDGSPMMGHKHAFYLPSDEDGDGRLDHVTLYASMGFEKDHRKVLGELSTIYGYGRRPDIGLMLLGMTDQPENLKDNVLIGPSKRWRSATPYILIRHPKTTRAGRWRTEPVPEGLEIKVPERLGRFPTGAHLLLEYGILPDLTGLQKDGPLAQLLLSVGRRGLPQMVVVEPLPEYESYSGVTHRWLEFKRRRRSSKSTVGGCYGFKVTFAEEIVGPIAIGNDSHRGMGLFTMESE